MGRQSRFDDFWLFIAYVRATLDNSTISALRDERDAIGVEHLLTDGH